MLDCGVEPDNHTCSKETRRCGVEGSTATGLLLFGIYRLRSYQQRQNLLLRVEEPIVAYSSHSGMGNIGSGTGSRLSKQPLLLMSASKDMNSNLYLPSDLTHITYSIRGK